MTTLPALSSLETDRHIVSGIEFINSESLSCVFKVNIRCYLRHVGRH